MGSSRADSDHRRLPRQFIEVDRKRRIGRIYACPQQPAERFVLGVAMGEAKRAAIRGALRGKLINGLITNESTAELLLKK